MLTLRIVPEDSESPLNDRSSNMAFKSTYKTVRNFTWLYYCLAALFFVWAIQAFPTSRNVDGSMNLFIWWVCMSGGLVYSAGRAKRKAAK